MAAIGPYLWERTMILTLLVIGAVVCATVTVGFCRGCKAQEMRIRESELLSDLMDLESQQ
jgi:hypothetical protein